jgi:flap endonuclease-1
VTTDVELHWGRPGQEAAVAFLVTEEGFSQARVENGCKNLEKAKDNKTRLRMDSFFAAVPAQPKGKPESFKKKLPVKRRRRSER